MFNADLARIGIQLSTKYSRRHRKSKVMDDRKEPPFFNEDNVGPFYYKLPFYDTMELFIETLTGTCFKLRVSPFEAVISVKAKIQRLEGLPICQQHLIWNNMELEDDYCLNDYNISEGCTLKLVLAMRGGPINTRKVPMEDPFREMAEFMESSREEPWEKACNKQVTYLVYREGDQLNFFRVVDRGDGTLTPLSESLSGGSVYNLYTDEDEEVEPSPSGQQIIENSVTMNKMKLLKAKMENMNLSKKPKKVVKVKPHPPVAPRPCSGSTAAARHRLLRVLPHIGQSCLPSPGNAYPSETPRSAASGLAAQPPTNRPVSSLPNEQLQEENDWESTTLSQSSSDIRLPPQVPHMELESDRALAGALLHLSTFLPKRTAPFSGNLPSNKEEETVLSLAAEECVPEESLLPQTGPFASFPDRNASEQSSALQGMQKAKSEFLPTSSDKGARGPEQHLKPSGRVVNRDAVDAAVLNHHQLSPHKNRLLSPLHCPAPMSLRSSLVKPQRQPKCPESGNLPASASHSMLRSLDVRTKVEPSVSRTARFRGIKVDSPGKRSDLISKVEARDITEMANKASKEPVGCVNNVGFFASLARSTSRDGLQGARGVSRLRNPGIGLSTSLQHFQDESLRKNSPQSEPTEFFLSARGTGMNGHNAAAGKRVGECTHHLPPVKAPLQTKKKTTKHCCLCGKKTGLATSYECRCGNNFCASHRYAETHGCTYDYKSAGRRYLQEANPVVNAPKLPKI